MTTVKTYQAFIKTTQEILTLYKAKKYGELYDSYICSSSKQKISRQNYIDTWNSLDGQLTRQGIEVLDRSWKIPHFLKDNNLKTEDDVQKVDSLVLTLVEKTKFKTFTSNAETTWRFKFEDNKWCSSPGK